jgi:hypothetical protein
VLNNHHHRFALLLSVPVAAVILGLAGCDKLLGLVDPQFPSDARRFSPPAVYSDWWDMTRACSGGSGSLDDLSWYKTSQPLRKFPSGDRIGGYWNSITHTIVISETLMFDGGAVRHEMLHALARERGHPRAQFLGRCGGVVLCERSCIEDAGPYPPPPQTPIHVTGDALDISTHIDPHNPSSARYLGLFSITVLVHNRSGRWVTVPSYYSRFSPNVDSSDTFEFDVRGPTGGFASGEVRLDPSEWIFAPGETKKHVFDLAIRGNSRYRHKFVPGSYIARGGYSDYMSAGATFVISP